MTEMYPVTSEEERHLRGLGFTTAVLSEMISEYLHCESLENRRALFSAIGKLEAQLLMLDKARATR